MSERIDATPADGVTPLPFHLRLGSPKAVRQSMARLVREHARGNVETAMFRTTVWALGQLVNVWRFEKDAEIERRIEEIERRLESGR